MDWFTALALSVPLASGVAAAGFYFGRSLERAALTHARNVNDGLSAVTARVQDSIERVFDDLAVEGRRNRDRSRAAEKHARKTALLVAEVEAEAAVKCARYSARVIRAKPPKEPMKPVTAHDRWLAGDGRKLPESVRDQVEWAVGRLRGTESDEQGDEEDAVSILDSFAPGLAESTKDEVRRAAGAA